MPYEYSISNCNLSFFYKMFRTLLMQILKAEEVQNLCCGKIIRNPRNFENVYIIQSSSNKTYVILVVTTIISLIYAFLHLVLLLRLCVAVK